MDGFTAGFIAGAAIGGFFAAMFVYAHYHDKREEDRAVITWLMSDLDELANAENNYRGCHDQVGPDHMRTGRAWDRMRRAGDEARKTIWNYRNTHKIVVAARKAAA
jgi:hypothetical protein